MNIQKVFSLLLIVVLNGLYAAQASDIKHIDLMIEPRGGNVEIDYPIQTIKVGEEDWQFSAHLKFCGQQQVEGSVKLLSPNSDPIKLTPLAVKNFAPQDSHVRTMATQLLLMSIDDIGTAIDPGNIIIAALRPDQDVGDCDIWDLLGADIEGGAGPIQFEAERIITVTEERCEETPDNRSKIAKIKLPEQLVFPDDGRDPVTIAAHVKISPNYHGFGFIEVAEKSHEIIFGAVLDNLDEPQTYLVGVSEESLSNGEISDMATSVVAIQIIPAISEMKKTQMLMLDIKQADDQLTFEAEGKFKIKPKLVLKATD